MGYAAVFPVASSVGVARSPRAGVSPIPCPVSGGWWACVGVICLVSDSRFCGVCWGSASPGVMRRPLGVGGRWFLRRGMPFLRVGPGARRDVLFACAPVPVPFPSRTFGGFVLPRCVAPIALSLWAPAFFCTVHLLNPRSARGRWAPACHIGRFRAPLPGIVPLCPLPSPCPCPFPSWCGGGGVRGGRDGPGLGLDGLEPLAD